MSSCKASSRRHLAWAGFGDGSFILSSVFQLGAEGDFLWSSPSSGLRTDCWRLQAGSMMLAMVVLLVTVSAERSRIVKILLSSSVTNMVEIWR